MSGPADRDAGAPCSDKLGSVLRAAAELFAGEALAFAAVLDDCEVDLAAPSDAVRLFWVRLCQIAEDFADPPPVGPTALIPHRGLIS